MIWNPATVAYTGVVSHSTRHSSSSHYCNRGEKVAKGKSIFQWSFPTAIRSEMEDFTYLTYKSQPVKMWKLNNFPMSCHVMLCIKGRTTRKHKLKGQFNSSNFKEKNYLPSYLNKKLLAPPHIQWKTSKINFPQAQSRWGQQVSCNSSRAWHFQSTIILSSYFLDSCRPKGVQNEVGGDRLENELCFELWYFLWTSFKTSRFFFSIYLFLIITWKIWRIS